MKKYILLPILILIVIVSVVLFLSSNHTSKKHAIMPASDPYKMLASCITEKDERIHYFVKLQITLLGKDNPLPANIGIDGTCMHHIVTHDSSGLIHIHLAQMYPLTLGDFFNTWGIVFNKRQLSSMIIADTYAMRMTINGKESHEYENYKLQSGDNIHIEITQKEAATNVKSSISTAE